MSSSLKSNESFAERQVVHFAMVLGRKWVCTEPGHEICYTGQGRHVPLTDDMIMTWVTALCSGEATTHLPPFDLRDELSGSDSDVQIQPDLNQQNKLNKLDMNMSKTINSSSNLHSNQKVSSPLRKYPSSSRISTISSFSQNSTSSWHSAGTGTGMGMGAYTSSSATSTSEGPLTPATAASFPYTSLKRVSSDKSIDRVSFSDPSRPVHPHLPSPPPLSPHGPPFSALPSPPLPLSQPSLPAHSSLISEYSDDRSNMRLRSPPQGKEQDRVSYPHPQSHSTQQAFAHPGPIHTPTRPVRHHNRPQSPNLTANTTKYSNIPSPHVQNPTIGPVVLRNIPLSHSQLPYTSASAPAPHSQAHPSYLYPSHSMTHLSHVREEEEGQSFQQPEWANGRDRDRERERQRKFIGDRDHDRGGGGGGADVDVDHNFDPDDDADETHSLGNTDEHEHGYEFERRSVNNNGAPIVAAGGGERTISRNKIHQQDAHNGDFDHESVGGSEKGGRSIWSPYTSFLPSINTTAPGNGGPASSPLPTVKSKWIESATLAKRAKTHLSRIKKWRKRAITTVIEGRYSKRGKEGAQVGTAERNIVIEMIGDGVEMARSCYPPRIHKLGYELGKEVQQWLQTFTDNDPVVLYKKENVSLLTTVQTCFLPILLMRIADIEPPAATLASNLIAALTKVPLSLHENELQTSNGSNLSPLFTSLPSSQKNRVRRESEAKSLPSTSSHNSMIPIIPHRTTSVSSIAIHMVARELGSPAPICPTQHSWLGMTLLKIVEMTMKLRVISVGEIEDIRMVGRKREGDYAQAGSYPTLIDARFTRPWEVALFALCASTETPAASFFRRMVLGPTGIPLLVISLNSLMALSIDMDDVKWEDVGLILRALAFVSEHAWVVQGMSVDNDETEGGDDKVVGVIKSIMNAFWRSIPERWFSIRFWAMDAVRNIVSHRPPLVRLLAEIKAHKAFITLTPSSPLYPVAINTSRTSVEGGGKIRNRLLEEYRKESAKRAEEMVDYIRMWYNATAGGDGGKNQDGSGFRNTVVLQPVAIGFNGR